MPPVSKKTAYHHGDLRESLLSAAGRIIRETGIEGLSLRKLAEQVGVSRTAPYHHFKDKNALLCAIAEGGFLQIQNHIATLLADTLHTGTIANKTQAYRGYIRGYIDFAAENPEVYDLMFGRTIWKHAQVTEELRKTAYETFQHDLQIVKALQEDRILPPKEDSLRFAQVVWGTLHGIARLVIDGVYADTSHIEEMCECAANLFIQSDVISSSLPATQ